MVAVLYETGSTVYNNALWYCSVHRFQTIWSQWVRSEFWTPAANLYFSAERYL